MTLKKKIVKHHLIILSIALNIVALVLFSYFIHDKGGAIWLKNKLFPDPRLDHATLLPKLPLPNVDKKILLLGDSHLAMHPWSEYSSLPFANRAAGGSRIAGINIGDIQGNPYLVIISTSTNDFQSNGPDELPKAKKAFSELIRKIKYRWPESKIIYISPPYPNVEIYEAFIRKRYPDSNRPTPFAIDAMERLANELGLTTLKAQSADNDGLHIDPASAKELVTKIERLYASELPDIVH